MSQVERGVMSLYEAPELRDELTDEEGQALLDWGQQQVEQLAAQGLNDIDFDEQVSQLKRLLRRMNRLAGRRMNMDASGVQKAVDRVADSAQALGLTVDPQRIQSYMAQPVSQSAGADVNAVIRLVSAADSPDTAADTDNETNNEEER